MEGLPVKTATSGHGTIAKRMENAGLAYEVTSVDQITSFILTGGPWVAVAQYQHNGASRIFVGFYSARGQARFARNAARDLRGVISSRVIHVEED